MSFKSCKGCSTKLPPQDKHDSCLRCLAKERHDDKKCGICPNFRLTARKSRAKDLKFYRNKLKRGFDISLEVPPSKRKRKAKKSKTSVTTSNISFESSRKRMRTSNDVPPLLPPPPPPPALIGNTFPQDKLTPSLTTSIRKMIREEITSSREQVDTANSPNRQGLSPSTSPGNGLTLGDSNTAFADDLTLKVQGLPKSPRIPEFSDSSSTSLNKATRLIPERHKLKVSSSLKSMTHASKMSLPYKEKTPRKGSETNVKMQEDRKKTSDKKNYNFRSTLHKVCKDVAKVLPEAVVPEPGSSSSVYRRPENSFSHLRILPRLISDVINPRLLGSHSRFDLPRLAKTYQMGEEEIFSLPLINVCLFTSITQHGFSKSNIEFGKTRKLPPFTSEASTLKVAYNCFEEQYRNACQQLRVAVHSEYIVILQGKLVDKSRGDPTLKKLSKLHGFLTQDMICSCACQIMSAVMGMRRLWLSVSRYPNEIQKSLLLLPFTMGSDLFPGAEAVLKDSETLMERQAPLRKQQTTSNPNVLGLNSAKLVVPFQSKKATKAIGEYKSKTPSTQQPSCRKGNCFKASD